MKPDSDSDSDVDIPIIVAARSRKSTKTAAQSSGAQKIRTTLNWNLTDAEQPEGNAPLHPKLPSRRDNERNDREVIPRKTKAKPLEAMPQNSAPASPVSPPRMVPRQLAKKAAESEPPGKVKRRTSNSQTASRTAAGGASKRTKKVLALQSDSSDEDAL